MISTRIIGGSLLLFFACTCLYGQTPTPSSEPAATGDAKVIATVGKKEIRVKDLNVILSRVPKNVPAEKIGMIRKQALTRLIQDELRAAYVAPLPCSNKEIAEYKEQLLKANPKLGAMLKERSMTLDEFLETQGVTKGMLQTEIKIARLQKKLIHRKSIKDFVKANPVAYFDGTMVTASHILLVCDIFSPPVEKRKARERLAQIERKILSEKMTFVEAARKHSGCPSALQGGDLGSFPFFGKMADRFSTAAFSMKEGEMSGIVETNFGFHLIKVTDRRKGTGVPGREAEIIAGRILTSRLHESILRKSMKKHPVVIK